MTGGTELRIAELEHRLDGGFHLLQILVGIRLRSVTDPESRRHLAWFSDIVAALGLLNRRLREGESAAFGSYLVEAVGFWRRACAGRPIKLEVKAAEVDLPESHALSLAIIAHELIGNAVRHAFPDERGGTIVVALTRTSEGISLLVRDTGVGGAALELGDGLALVLGLADHLGGAMTIETAPGAGVGVRVRVPLEDLPLH